MGNRYASGKNSIAMCDRCGFQFKLTNLRKEIVKTKVVNMLVCPSCFDPDQPQLQLGMYPVDDPQAVRNPRRDSTYVVAGLNVAGFNTGGSRDIQWGWAPVGGSSFFTDLMTPNDLLLTTAVGQVTISVT
tara:strand:- start:2963 stop:3352 length:390 start_codon:yes stop_codon:yes gene_type:complete